LIRDIRRDLGAPDLPVTIGVSGMFGFDNRLNSPHFERKQAVVKAQLNVGNSTKYPEFADNVLSVETRGFYRDELHSPSHYGYHWNNNCESYWLIGQAMGRAMVQLLRTQRKKQQLEHQQQQEEKDHEV